MSPPFTARSDCAEEHGVVNSEHMPGGVPDAGWKVHRDLEADRREQAPA